MSKILEKAIQLAALSVKRYPNIVKFLGKIAHEDRPEIVAVFDYPVYSQQRWTIHKPHEQINSILNDNRSTYKDYLNSFLNLSDFFEKINLHASDCIDASDPSWINGWIPALDGIALYGFIVLNKPKLYIEIGSGNSTKFARKAISDHGLNTKIISIDPCPRAEVNKICDEIIRKPIENISPDIFFELGENDILFVDSSHRVFMNSDVTAIFIDVIPCLKKGVLVEFHDIFLPYDYPSDWGNRYYAEQYLLAAYLLAGGKKFDILLPNMFISLDKELKQILFPLKNKIAIEGIDLSGGSFWIKTT